MFKTKAELAGSEYVKKPTTGFYRKLFASKAVLLIAFAFTVMADPISSVAYAIEAALRALNGNLGLLLPTMGLVVLIIGIISINYHQLIGRFPEGGGAAAAAGTALGEGWAFLPIGALVVDFILTISISIAASTAAVIAYFPNLAALRIPLALSLLLIVGGLSWFGHGGRTIFAIMTLTFVGTGLALLVAGFLQPPAPYVVTTVANNSFSPALIPIILAFPVAMALATGVEAPSSAIAQLGQLDAAGRKLFGRLTLWMTLIIVGGLTLGITALAVRNGIGLPPAESTQIAELARTTGSNTLFAIFQLTTTLLLLAAASSSFQAGPGLLKALATTIHPDGVKQRGILPSWMGKTNHHHTPYWSLALYLVVAAVVTVIAGANDQELVLFYAVSVFLSFLVGLIAMARLSKGQPLSLIINVVGAGVVGFTLIMNLARGLPIISLAMALLIAAGLYWAWVKAGRPRGVASAVQHAEETEE